MNKFVGCQVELAFAHLECRAVFLHVAADPDDTVYFLTAEQLCDFFV